MLASAPFSRSLATAWGRLLKLGACKLLGLRLGHFQVGSYRYRSLIEGLYTLLEAL